MKLAPVVDELATEFDGRAKIVKVNAHENFATSAQFGVRMLPTILLIKDGKVLDQKTGFFDKGTLSAWIEKAM